MDYKYKNTKKTTSINSTNFIIKNINSLGHSVYNKQNTYNSKKVAGRKVNHKNVEKPKYKGLEYKVSNNTNGLFPYILNTKAKEQGVYVYK